MKDTCNIDGSKQKNPLYSAKIGSIFNSETGKIGSTVIGGEVSVMNYSMQTSQAMTGASQSCYSESMNRGSFTLSGNYGISGISRFKSAVSGYLGNSSAVKNNSIVIEYNYMISVGTEYIDFNNMKVADFLSNLKEAEKVAAIAALDEFSKLVKLYPHEPLKNIMKNPDNFPDFIDSFKKWINACKNFKKTANDCFVVGVDWGGIAQVKTEFTKKSSQSTWKYGGNMNFTYSGLSNATTIGGTYDGSSSDSSTDVRVDIHSDSIGGCASTYAENWTNQLQNKSQEELWDTKVFDQAPAIANQVTPPAMPELTKKEASKSLTDKIGSIKDLDGLKAYAQAEAYEKAKLKDSKLTLTEFLTWSNEKSNTTQEQKLEDQISSNTVTTISEENLLNERQKRREISNKFTYQKFHTESSLNSDPEYVALGIYIIKWSDIFPWLNEGILNEVVDISEASLDAKIQTMAQDFLALSRIYAIASDGNLYCELVYWNGGLWETLKDEFYGGVYDILSLLGNPDKGQSDLDDIYLRLTKEAREIYTTWVKNPMLRNFEVCGSAIIKGETFSGEIISGHKHGITEFKKEKSNFDFKAKNYFSFKKSLKLIPIIVGKNRIRCMGPTSDDSLGYLGTRNDSYTNDHLVYGIVNLGYTMHGSGISIAHFETSERDGCSFLKCNSTDAEIGLIPIPYSATKHSDGWTGTTINTNLSSYELMRENIQSTIDSTKTMDKMTFIPNQWQGITDWNGFFPNNELYPQYVGLLERNTAIFGN
ncbi:hypothetical protein J8L98_24185 [Pseudoalteromonas sp. MMG013]|uniref:hypothetical protein n=1 Tax=Pseudoalteromonas sp. MMG013 TaxID=2822687 RepID=UPI001B361BC0|nr:hypothetical protein [Pseudoalteromonas sp. MMG013]MBQ4864788.1 hypothetical protein [Pseudoalteromonas sp. MMG013]